MLFLLIINVAQALAPWISGHSEWSRLGHKFEQEYPISQNKSAQRSAQNVIVSGNMLHSCHLGCR